MIPVVLSALRPPLAISALDILTLVVAIAGVGLGAASLAWQTATFVLSGSRVRVELRRGGIRREPNGIVRMMGPPHLTDSDYAAMAAQGFRDEALFVIVRNVGRLAVSVESVTMETDAGWGFETLADAENRTLPHRLEPGAKEVWHAMLDPLRRIADVDATSRKAWMTVELGTGRRLRTKDRTNVSPATTG